MRKPGKHYLATSQGDIYRNEIFEMLNDLGPRSIVMVTDCCSSIRSFQPPMRRKPAKWKVFHNLFYENVGLVDITAAETGTEGWFSSGDGGLLTKCFTNFLCEPPQKIRADGETGDVTWADFFARVRQSTTELFEKYQDGAADDDEIKNAKAQRPIAFSLGGWPTQFRRQLVVNNSTGRKLCVWVQYYDVNFATGEWQWYYPTANGKRYEIDAGKQLTLRHNDWTIGCTVFGSGPRPWTAAIWFGKGTRKRIVT